MQHTRGRESHRAHTRPKPTEYEQAGTGAVQNREIKTLRRGGHLTSAGNYFKKSKYQSRPPTKELY